jgi:cysteine sulfinate desulfinase/cysteine desulfurase-like protein
MKFVACQLVRRDYERSHVLVAMGLDGEQIDGTVRLSWAHCSEKVDWRLVAKRVAELS